MRITEEELKDFHQRKTSRSVRARSDCLTEEVMLRAAKKKLSGPERKLVVAHLRDCSDCSREYRVAHSARQWSAQVSPFMPGADPAARQPEIRPGSPAWLAYLKGLASLRGWRAAALVATVVIAVGLSWAIYRQLQQSNGPAPNRIGTERGNGVSTMQVDPAERATLSEPPQRLSWSAVASAESYQVALYDFQLTPLWESEPLTSTTVQIPESVRKGLSPGRVTYWRVIITSGIERRQSKLFEFSLTSK
ncbi:MAG TPA: hypothetical protein VLD57_08590 [Blastocatellia bacterium]|nr:hypothetical protein [Blastocatellia bacterium]